MRTGSSFFGALLLSATLAAGSACRERPPDPPQPQYSPTATIKDLMDGLVDPSADVVWEAVKTVVSKTGTEETVPRTDQDWVNTRHGALRLAEATNLLMMPGRHVARPGEKSFAPGVELEPEQIEALINEDREGWNSLARGLYDASVTTLKAVDDRNVQALFDVGEKIQQACESCHSRFWYPNQPLPPNFNNPGTP